MKRALLSLLGIPVVATAGLIAGYFGYQAYLKWLISGQGPGESREIAGRDA